MDYGTLVESIFGLHHTSIARAVAAMNRSLLLRNWMIGAYLIEYEQRGRDRARYRSCLLASLARDLRRRGIGGCSAEMLGRMRLFYRAFPQLASQIPSPMVTELPTLKDSVSLREIWSPPVTKSDPEAPPPLAPERILQLSWTHWIELLHLEDPWKRAFYENECLDGKWSKRQLHRQIGSMLYERTGLSTDKRSVIEAARRQAADAPGSIAELIRDPYVLEFVGLSEKPRYSESDLEAGLLDHLQKFLLELGTGFCFEARQKRMTVGNEHDYLDLVFYHRRLRCNLLVDLKIRPFRHADAGQMNFYLNYWRANELEEGDNPPVGLLLCSDRSSTRVQYATAGLDQQLFVSRYLVALPAEDRVREWIEADRAALETAANSGGGRVSVAASVEPLWRLGKRQSFSKTDRAPGLHAVRAAFRRSRRQRRRCR